MGLDMNFYKKDFVELDSYFGTRNKELFNFIIEKCGLVYGNDEYEKYVKLNKTQLNKIIKYMNKNNNHGIYTNTIAEIGFAKENNQDVYICADW